MNVKRFALMGGTLMLVLGLLALFPGFSRDPARAGLPALVLDMSYGQFVGLIPMNILNKLALILFGMLGILSATSVTGSLPNSIRFSRLVFFAMAPLAILGVIPATQTLRGYWPLFGGDVALHAIFAALGAYFGFTTTGRVTSKQEEEIESGMRRAA